MVVLGAYTRLKDAGLGCPDWPGCYGQLTVPQSPSDISAALARYPTQPIQATKASAEMMHRYFAGTLGLLMSVLFFWSLVSFITRYRRNQTPYLPIKVPFFLYICLGFQAMLGMWTVTWQLLPLVVMGHLLGGMTITTLLWWLTLSASPRIPQKKDDLNYLTPWVVIGMIIVFFQIFLGGWTSANYASIICPDFPTCHGTLFPHFDFSSAFNFLSPIGRNYQGGVLQASARVTIQMMHRYGAFVTAAYIGSLSIYILFSKKTERLKNTAGIILLALATQIFFGIMNIETLLYLPIALTHNAVALFLLLSLTTLFFQLYQKTLANKEQN